MTHAIKFLVNCINKFFYALSIVDEYLLQKLFQMVNSCFGLDFVNAFHVGIKDWLKIFIKHQSRNTFYISSKRVNAQNGETAATSI